MSGSSSVAAAAGGGDGYRPPFTAMQWQELEHQALIYKYLVAGVPVPTDLVVPIRRSLEALSARFFHHPTLGYCSYYGKKFDPEPGRCRRTDGKKWRCSKDAYSDSKYCERHMHRGRNRSRKPVESQSTSQSLSTVSSSGNGNYSSVSSISFQNQPLYPNTNPASFDFGSNVSKFQVDTSPYGVTHKDVRYAQGVFADVDEQNYCSSASWNTQVPTDLLLKHRDDSYIQNENIIDTSKQQHCFFGSPEHGQHPFFDDEWRKAKEPWSDLDSNNSFSATQLSMSTASPEFIIARTDCSPNGA